MSVQNLLFIVFIILAAIIILAIIIKLRLDYIRKNRMFEGTLSVYAASPEVDDGNSLPVENFKGRVYLRDFCLQGTDFPDEAYFEVIKDTSSHLPKGNFSHKLRFVSPREFYYQDSEGEKKIKSLELNMNMDYIIRSHSEEDFNANDDSITISLSD